MRCKSAGEMDSGEARQARVVLRRWVASLLLLSFFVRAIIPTGYMPDLSAASEGVFKVVICTAAGAKTLALEDSGAPPLPGQQGGHHDQPCSFTAMADVAIPAFDAVQLASPDFRTSNLTPRRAVLLPPPRAGPQLGSRGPPTVL